TRSEGDNALGTRRELLQLVAHQLNDVVGERGRGNDLRIVCPATPVGIEREAAFLLQRLQELYDKEGVAVCFALEERGQWPRLSEVPVQGIPYKVREILQPQGRHGDVIELSPSVCKRSLGLA